DVVGDGLLSSGRAVDVGQIESELDELLLVDQRDRLVRVRSAHRVASLVSKRRFVHSSTRTRCPGCTRIVVSTASIIAGPSTTLPGSSSSRRCTVVATKPNPRKNTRRSPVRALAASAEPISFATT